MQKSRNLPLKFSFSVDMLYDQKIVSSNPDKTSMLYLWASLNPGVNGKLIWLFMQCQIGVITVFSEYFVAAE